MKRMYLATFKWPGQDEPLMVGANKAKLRRAARDQAIRKYGPGYVYRPTAMCAVKITLGDIRIVQLPVLGQDEPQMRQEGEEYSKGPNWLDSVYERMDI